MSLWPTPKGTDADRGGRGDLIQAVRGNVSPSGHFRSPSDPCSPASEDSTSASNGPVCTLCGSASRIPSASGSLPGTGPEFRAIPTCAPLWPTPTSEDGRSRNRGKRPIQTATPTLAYVVNTTEMGQRCPCRCHTSTSSAAGSPARTSASPAAGQDWPENARAFGGSSQGSLGNYDPATSSLRTSQLSLIEDSTQFLRTLPRAGSMRNGTIYQRRPLAPLTAATGSGLLPTPVAKDDGKSPEAHMAMKQRMPGGPRQTITSLAVLARNDFVQADGTRARLGTARGPQAKRYHDAVAASGTPGSLNPTWVEWLMGYPLGWTDCAPSATASSPRSPNGSENESSNGKDGGQ